MSDTSTIDDDILSSVPDLDDGVSDDINETQEVSASEEETGTEEATPEATGGEGTAPQSQQEPEAQQASRAKDLLDKDGNLIAKSGAERRHYETAQRLRVENQTVRTELQNTKAQLDAIQAAGTLGTQFSLSPEQLTQGAQIMRGIIDDPVNTLNFLLTQAQAAGHNIDGIGGQDMSAIKQMVTEAVRPLTEAQQVQLDTQRQAEEGQRLYNEFNTRHPDAQPHHAALAQLIQKEQSEGRSIDVETAYYQLRNFYLERNLDWSKPLEQLMQEHREAQAAPAQSAPPQGETIPAGSNGMNTANVNDPDIAAATADSADIIRKSMEEAGYNFN